MRVCLCYIRLYEFYIFVDVCSCVSICVVVRSDLFYMCSDVFICVIVVLFDMFVSRGIAGLELR